MKIFKHQGESLIELIVVIAVSIIIVTALVFATISSLRDSQFAKNQAQATKYAQDWIEQLKINRDQDQKVIGSDGNPIPWSAFLANGISCSASGSGYEDYTFDDNSVLTFRSCNANTDQAAQDAFANSSINYDNPDGKGVFKRYILVSVDGSSIVQKKFTVIVQWTDFSGSHESKLTTTLGAQ